MEESEKFEVREKAEDINKERKLKLKKAKKEKKVKKDAKAEMTKEMLWEYRKERLIRPILKIFIIFFALVLIIMAVWSVLSPGKELEKAYDRDVEITDKVTAGLRIKELEAEVESLEAELLEREKEIAELSQKLGQANALPAQQPLEGENATQQSAIE